MGTSNYDLPLISGIDSVKIPRDFNRLAISIDDVLKKEINKISVYTLDVNRINISDASSSIQSVLDYVATLGGGMVVIPPTTSPYILSKTLYIPENVTLSAWGATLKLNPLTHDYMVREGIQRKAIKTPKGVVATALTSSGTLSPGSYAYRVTAFNAIGETMPCSEVSTLLSDTGSVKIEWVAPLVRLDASPLVGYKIYGRTTGNINQLLGTVSASTLTFTDGGAPGTNASLPRTNTTFGRQKTFRVFGGTWDASHRGIGRPSDGHWQDDNWAGHAFCIEHCDFIHLNTPKIMNAAKWCVAISDFGEVIADHLRFDSGSDGIHVLGPGKRVVINDVKGTVGDDMVGVSMLEWPDQAASEGDIDEVIVKDVFIEEGFSAVRILGGTNTFLGSFSAERVRGSIKGTTATAAIYANNDQSSPGRVGTRVGKIRIKDVDLQWPDAPTKPIVHLAATSIDDVIIEDVRGYGDGRVVCKLAFGDYKNVIYRNIKGRNGNNQTGLLLGTGGATTIDSLDVDNIDMRNPSNTGSIAIDVRSSVTVNVSVLQKLRVQHSDYSGHVFSITGSQFKNISFVNCFGDKTDTLLLIGLNSIIGSLLFSDVVTNTVDGIRTQSGNFQVEFNGFVAGGTGSLLNLVGASANGIRIRSGNVRQTYPVSVKRDGSQTIRSEDSRFHADLRLVGLGAGDMVWADYGGTEVNNIGTGRLICNGTTWKNLYTGLTYTP